MPELAEVETSRLSLLAALHPISSAQIVSIIPSSKNETEAKNYDDIVCECSLEELESALVGKTIVSINRKGKQLWMDMEGSGSSVLFHFGMTGVRFTRLHRIVQNHLFR